MTWARPTRLPVLAELRRQADPRSLVVRIPDVVRALIAKGFDLDAIHGALLSLDDAHEIELRPESESLTPAEAALCPRGEGGTVLSSAALPLERAAAPAPDVAVGGAAPSPLSALLHAAKESAAPPATPATPAMPAMPAPDYPDEPEVDGQCPVLEERLHAILDEAGVAREGLNLRARLAGALRVRLHRAGEAVPAIQANAARSVRTHEEWAAGFRKRWKARDDAEELWKRRGSEQSAEQMLDQAGIPSGDLSFNGRLALALGLRYASMASNKATPAAATSKDAVGRARALLAKLPAAPWPVNSGEMSLDVEDTRVRLEKGGTREMRRSLVQWIAESRPIVEELLAMLAKKGKA